MGEGGDYVVLDDPHNVEQAESDDVRDDTVRKIRLALPTRVRSADGAVVAIMQRLHARDFAGRVLTEESGWAHVCLPARFENDHPHRLEPLERPGKPPLPGDPRTKDRELLWPELFPEERLSDLEERLGSYGSAGQLQQRPAPRRGGVFQREWFSQRIPAAEVPAGGEVVRGWDFAASTEADAKYSAAVRIRRVDRKFYVEDAWRDRVSPGRLQVEMRRLAESDGSGVTIDIPQDPGQAGKYQAADLVGLFPEFTIRASPESGSKVTRAEPFAAQAEAGNVILVEGSWNDPYVEELAGFPRGDFSDWVDASSRAYHRARRVTGGFVGAAPEVYE